MQTKMVKILAGAALSLGMASTVLAQSSMDQAAAAERNAAAAGRSSFQGGTGATMNVGGLIQFRYNANFRSDDGTNITRDDDTTIGFSNARTKIWFKGDINSDLSYGVMGAFDNGSSGSFNLDDAYFVYKFSDMFSVKGGQFKLPVLREELVADSNQLAVDRSLTNQVFTQGRSQGVSLNFKSGDNFRGSAAFSDGLRTKNTDFNSSSESDWAVTGRVEFKWAGDWDRFADFTSFKGQGNAGMVGAALHYQASQNTGDGIDSSLNTAASAFMLYTIDAALEGDGWNLYGALIGSFNDPDNAGEDSTNTFGLVVQGGVFVADQWELFGRWDAIFADKDAGSGPQLDPKTFHFITAGVNYYLIPGKHTMKFTLEGIVALNETAALRSTDPTSGAGGSSASGFGSSLPFTNGSILGDVDSGEFSLVAQVQVLF